MQTPCRVLPMPKTALGRLPQLIRVNAAGRPQAPPASATAATAAMRTPAPRASPALAPTNPASNAALTPGQNFSPSLLHSSPGASMLLGTGLSPGNFSSLATPVQSASSGTNASLKPSLHEH